jgi:threonine/homoserine/homoserine lactone efflux protein
MAVIINGVIFGFLLSFLLGPAFFVLIETSIKKGFKSAVFLDIGILLSDAIYLLASLFVAEKINSWLNENSYIKYIAGSIFIILGLISIYRNYLNLKIENNQNNNLNRIEANANNEIYPFQLIIKGLGLNAINPGVLVFWIAACTYATNELNFEGVQLLYYFGTTLITMFCIDLLKIYYSSKLKKTLTNKTISLIGLIIGCLLIFFGIAVCLKDIQI